MIMLVVVNLNTLYIFLILFADIHFIKSMIGINLGVDQFSFLFLNPLSIACTFLILITFHPKTIVRTTVNDKQEYLYENMVL